jgi:hypothetical protein
VVSQCQKTNDAREPYHIVISSKNTSDLNVEQKNVSITYISREDNQREDLLSKLKSSNSVEFLVDVWVEVLEEPNIGKDDRVVVPINIINDWRIPITNYL